MIPSVLSKQIEQGIKDFLATTFHATTPFFHRMMDRFFNSPGKLFKGPYLSINLPFQTAEEASKDFFPGIPLSYTPYLHQQKAFERLSGETPHPTIIATGTGSGKTECFLYPILDYCLKQVGQSGIKAVLIYPMNALAFDQATRLAKIIHDTPALQGKVTAGMYVGQREKHPTPVMGPETVITDKDILRGSPPDILLTNYKMLDYLLIRPRDAKLWNQNKPDTLRYVVVDELHTFDGAQGTDLACLLRRLKAKLSAPEKVICPVGTSATLGGEESRTRLCDYAGQIFGEPFLSDAIIPEYHQSVGEFVKDQEIEITLIPEIDQIKDLLPHTFPAYPTYIRRQMKLWVGIDITSDDWPENTWRKELGKSLTNHRFFRNLLLVLNGKTCSYDTLLSELIPTAKELKSGDSSFHTHLLNSFLALISEAKFQDNRKLQVRIQHWCREMKRMVVSVETTPCLQFADDLTDQERQRHLPVVHCRECGLMGWVAKSPLHGSGLEIDLQSIYVEFFKRKSSRSSFLYPVRPSDPLDNSIGNRRGLCPECMHINRDLGGNCASCGSDKKIMVDIPESTSHHCPTCGARNSLTLLGSQAASLTSVMIGQLFASNFNDDKKLLTFSDNVQDAAHRAAFFGARTYRFLFRTALQQFVGKFGQGLSLETLADRFVEHWRNNLDAEQFVALFIAPNMTWLHDFEYLKIHEKLPGASQLPNLIARRLRWEVFSEYGFSARIGRTLEKSGGSVLALDPNKIQPAIDRLSEVLSGELEEFKEVNSSELAAFILGLITSIRQQGGIFHSDLEEYIAKWGNTFQISQRRMRWMPNFGPATRSPAFVTTKSDVDRFPRLLSSQDRSSWYEWWASRLFPQLAMPFANLVENFFEIVFKQLEQAGIIDHRWQNQHYVWGLNPQALVVMTDVQQFYCEKCGHILAGSAKDIEIWQNVPCLRRNCDGLYIVGHQGLDYYGHLYSSGDISRLYTEEHTGLLAREDRQRLEENFKKPQEERKPWHPNLLSSTPTLEMGIDIGDLSTTIQCSVPPGQANYLQRIGRSGRKNGNGLNLTVANGQPHDLYFFHDPLEMIAGDINPPGVFLDASAVLERQFMAYCFDRWVSAGLLEEAIPNMLGSVLNQLAQKDSSKFPNNLIKFVTSHQAELFNGFIELFKQEISHQSIKHLEMYVFGNDQIEPGLNYRIVARLNELYKARQSLKYKVDQLYREIKKMEASTVRDQNYYEDLSQLKMERSGLQTLIKSMNAKETFNFFTDEGLLPNYAFPESGIVLNSIIYRKISSDSDTGKHYESKSYTYERPSSSGIRELAPNNSFYAEGRRVVIDKVDMRLSDIESWRMCDACPHMEQESLAGEHQLCPRCGSSLWSDQGRKQDLIRVRQVFANTSDWRSRIADDRDEREPVFYTTNMLVDVDDKTIIDAYQIDDPVCPFGFEFLAKATLREINFGPCGKTSQRLRIAGQEMERPGFVICKRCGKVQNRSGEIEHDFGCPARNREEENNFIDCVYLYREFSSEAIKILLPVTGYEGSERRLNSFVAALQLGLMHYFGGSTYVIDHLQTTVSSEPVPDANISKQYLILYDTVPGGTGFLKQLMRSDTLMNVLEKALITLQHCRCHKDPGKDGCYACLFAYRNSYTMATTSRNTAIDMLSEILSHRQQIQQVNNLKNLSVTGLLDSELEALFLEGLRRLRQKGFSVALKKTIVNGKPGYFLEINNCVYEIEPQVELTPANGIAIPSRADFVFWPARSKGKIKPIVVFTDGFVFHRNRVGLDMAQRMAIVQSGAFHVWSITWKDVNAQFNLHTQPIKTLLHPENSRLGSPRFFSLLNQYGLEDFHKRHTLDSFLLFAHFLTQPDLAQWQRYALVQTVSHLNMPSVPSDDAYDQWRAELIGLFPEQFLQNITYGTTEVLTGTINDDLIKVWCWASKVALQDSDPLGLNLFGYLRDDIESLETEVFESQWINYLRLYNLFQFLPCAIFVSQSGIDKGFYFELKTPTDATVSDITDKTGPPLELKTGQQKGWDEAFSLTAEAIHPQLKILQKKNKIPPEVGYELAINGEVVGEAELAWPDQQLAYLTEDQTVFKETFEKAGWMIKRLEDLPI